MTGTLLRVEPEDGEGPFYSGFARENLEEHAGWVPNDGPDWHADDIRASGDHQTFLVDLEQVDYWFRGPHKRTLHEHGYRLAEYEVVCIEDAHICVGMRQAAANKRGLNRVSMHPLVDAAA